MTEIKIRNNAIDMMKGLLAILMTISHLTYITSYWANSRFVTNFNIYVNLTTFSGFMFCFGSSCWTAYINTDRGDVEKRLINGGVKTLAAFYISGISFFVFYEYSPIDILGVFFLQKIPSLSEFLLSFTLVYMLLLYFRKVLRKMNIFRMIALAGGGLVMTWLFPFEIIVSPVMGSIIGTTEYCCFPVAGYMIYFLLGSIFSKYGGKFWKLILLLSSLGTCAFVIYYITSGAYPRRFPPTPIWIIGGMLPIYIYYILFTLIDKKGIDIKGLSFWGKQTLVLLVTGNVILFALRGSSQDRIQAYMTKPTDVPKFLLVIIVVFLISYLAMRIGNLVRSVHKKSGEN